MGKRNKLSRSLRKYKRICRETTTFCKSDLKDANERQYYIGLYKKYGYKRGFVEALMTMTAQFKKMINKNPHLADKYNLRAEMKNVELRYNNYTNHNFNIFLEGTTMLKQFQTMKLKHSASTHMYIYNAVIKPLLDKYGNDIDLDMDDETIEALSPFYYRERALDVTIFHQDPRYSTLHINVSSVVYKKGEDPKISMYLLFHDADDDTKQHGVIFQIGHYDETQEYSNEYVSLIFNLFTYMDVYRDKIHVGVPTLLKNKTLKHSVTITNDDSFLLDCTTPKGTKSAHIRSAHFKHLSHERYGENRGKMIFVKSCFVNGGIKSIRKKNSKLG